MRIRTISTSEVVTLAILTLFSIGYMWISPPTTAPDEIAHLAYPRHILFENEMPSFTSPQDTWESHQPPLYYLIAIPFVKAFESVPIYTQLQLDRLISVLLYVLALFIMQRIFYSLKPDVPFLRSSALLLLGIPMGLYIAGSFNNDALLIPGSAVLMWVCINKKRFRTPRHFFFLGLLFGLIALTKVHLYPIALLVGLFVLWRKQFRYWFTLIGGALITSSWWFIHNISRVGDLFGIKYTFLLWENQRSTSHFFEQLPETVKKLSGGFIGIFGKFSIALPWFIYGIFAIILVVIIVLGLKKIRSQPRLQILYSGLVCSIALVFFQNTYFYQPQGRYLLALVPIISLIYLLSYPSKTKNKTTLGIFVALVCILTASNAYSLFTISDYYTKNPIHSFDKRNIELVNTQWIGEYNISETGDLLLEPGAHIYTLRDFRLPSEHNPALRITTTDDLRYDIVVSWKILGQHNFLESKSVQLSIQNMENIIIRENLPTLIQDIQITSDPSNSGPIPFSSIELHTN